MEIIAHRSGPVDFPEQTVEAGKQSLSLGADIVEIDVRLSADGEIVISHDHSLDRIFGVNKKTDELTQTEFVNLERKEGAPYHGHTLADYVSGGVLPLLLHIKESRAIPKVLNFIRENGLEKEITLGLHSPETISIVKKADSGIRVLAFMRDPFAITPCIKAGADIIRLWEGWYTTARRDRIHKNGAKLWIMTGGLPGFEVGETTPARLRKMVDRGVDGILLNNVALLTEILKAQ